MGSQSLGQAGSKRSLSTITRNKVRRNQLFVQQKKAGGKDRHDERRRRKKEEDKNPELRAARLAKNKPVTLDEKRIWDDGGDDGLYSRVNVVELARRRRDEAEKDAAQVDEPEDLDVDYDSMLESSDDENTEARKEARRRREERRAQRDTSSAPSTTSTNLDLTPSSLYAKFPTLFSDLPPPTPKVLITTSLNSTLHDEAHTLCTLFPNSNYVPRSSHRYGHKYSLREISRFAANRDYTAVILLREDLKRPYGLTVVCLPSGPTFTFSITNWVPGKKLPGHGNPSNHYPELLLNNFSTPLGLLTSRLFCALFPPRPEFGGRQVVTMHNQRDYIFVRRHRYVFRDRRTTEKSVVDAEGKALKGVEDIRTGLQELGPRMTLKLRRVDKGIGRAGSQGEDAQQWEWKAKMEKDRKVFNL